ncbi:MAG: insulinase family protein [Anaeromyxobacter sp.]
MPEPSPQHGDALAGLEREGHAGEHRGAAQDHVHLVERHERPGHAAMVTRSVRPAVGSLGAAPCHPGHGRRAPEPRPPTGRCASRSRPRHSRLRSGPETDQKCPIPAPPCSRSLLAASPALAQQLEAPARTAPAKAAPARPAVTPALPAIPEIAFERHVLPNGLTVIIHEDHKAPIAAVNVWYHVGSKNERLGKTGFAHLFEHADVQRLGTLQRRLVQGAGADRRHGPERHHQQRPDQLLPERCRCRRLDTGVLIESDRMATWSAPSASSQAGRQRGVVQTRRSGRARTSLRPGDGGDGPLNLPHNHPYSWPPSARLKEWFKTYYGAANATVVVAGDVKPAEVLKKVLHYFGDIPAGPPGGAPAGLVAEALASSGGSCRTGAGGAPVPGLEHAGSGQRRRRPALAGGRRPPRGRARGSTSGWSTTRSSAPRSTPAPAPPRSAPPSTSTIPARPGGDLAPVEAAVREELKRGPRAPRRRGWAASCAARSIGGFGGTSDALAEHQVMEARRTSARSGRARARRHRGPGDAARRWLSDGAYVLSCCPTASTPPPAPGPIAERPAPGGPGAGLPGLQGHKLGNGLGAWRERHAVPAVQLDLLVDAGYASDQFAARLASATWN